jgi:integrase
MINHAKTQRRVEGRNPHCRAHTGLRIGDVMSLNRKNIDGGSNRRDY